jgi:hypothetical protein
MSGDTFEVTYPCYLPMGESESYLTIISDGDHCLPLLTDNENVERFFRRRFPNRATIEVHTLTIPVREVLINVLKQFEVGRESGKHDISHIAFDPADQAIVPRTTIAEFIEYLETEAVS